MLVKKPIYVISAQRLISYTGKKLENPEWEYAQYDDFGGYASGYPCLGSLYHAIKFNSVEEAEEWLYKNKKYLGLDKNYNLSSLGIRKMEIKFTTVENIKMI